MPGLSITQLRSKHSTFRYDSFSYRQLGDNELQINFEFTLEPDLRFSPQIVIPYKEGLPRDSLDNLIFHLGLIELLSYWKAACAPRIIVRAGKLDVEQIKWWRDLLLHGLGEFFFRNNIDFSCDDFVQFVSEGTREFGLVNANALEGDLILVAGGKDSAVTLELLKQLKTHRQACFTLNPIPASQRAVEIAGYPSLLSASRTIDPLLLKLNQEGYLNGHTPFSAYLAFLGVLLGSLQGLRHVIVSNESSANEENLNFHGMPINHQYSKGYRFEKLFREYCQRYLCADIQYFSFLRPLNELQVSMLFAGCRAQHQEFRSCNVHRSRGSWCGTCPKCAFVYLVLSAFLKQDQLREIFRSNLFESPQIVGHLRQLLGICEHKPFECVGTVNECRAALAMTIAKMKKTNEVSAQSLATLASELPQSLEHYLSEAKELLGAWSKENFLPDVYEALLKKEIAANELTVKHAI